jgi:hypothetical protein
MGSKMQRITEALNRSWETSRSVKKLLFLVAAIYTMSFLAGYLMVHSQTPFAMELSDLIIQSIPTSPVISPIIDALMVGNLALAIAVTFLVNLSIGAFASTTLPGVIPLIGGLGSIAVSGFRGFTIGVVYYEAFKVSTGYTVVALGTAILELGAYVFSTAAGINISLSTIFPNRYQVDGRWVAFKEAWQDAIKIYLIIAILLALGAIWEMVGIYISMPQR